MKRWLVLFHRWAGVVGCAAFVVWFLSGLAMMYVEMPYLQQSDLRMQAQPELPQDRQLLSPWQAVQKAGVGAPIASMKLVSQVWHGRPIAAWLTRTESRELIQIDATTGQRLGPWTREQAGEVAASWRAGRPRPVWRERAVVDQWTLPEDQFAAHRPLHRFVGDDGVWVYVSEVTGRVVQEASRRDRLLATLGPVTHWIYPTVLRRRAALWSGLVTAMAALGSLTVAAGLALGVWNWVWRLLPRRDTRDPRSRRSPYRHPLMRWHHRLGMIFGWATLTWVFSGWLSMEPLPVAPSSSPSEAQVRVLAGGVGWTAFDQSPALALRLLSEELAVKELEARFFAGRPVWVAFETPKKSRVLEADATAQPALELPQKALRSRAERMVAGARLISWSRLESYDDFYYSKLASAGAKRLPVYRGEYDDAQRTVLYIDPHRGEIVRRSRRANRLVRYLYNGLHSWDFAGFFNQRPAWDLVVGLFMLGGSVLSMTSLVLAVGRLKSSLRLGRATSRDSKWSAR